jgi:hypothetical protein
MQYLGVFEPINVLPHREPAFYDRISDEDLSDLQSGRLSGTLPHRNEEFWSENATKFTNQTNKLFGSPRDYWQLRNTPLYGLDCIVGYPATYPHKYTTTSNALLPFMIHSPRTLKQTFALQFSRGGYNSPPENPPS